MTEVRPAYIREARRLLSTSIISVETRAIHLDDVPDDKDLGNMPMGNAHNPADLMSEDRESDSNGIDGEQLSSTNPGEGDQISKEKMTVTFKHFQRLIRAIVVHLRQLEDDDSTAAGSNQQELQNWYVQQLHENQPFGSIADMVQEMKRVKAIIQIIIMASAAVPTIQRPTEVVQDLRQQAVQNPGTVDFSDDLAEESGITPAFRNLWRRATSVMSEDWSLRFAYLSQRDMLAMFKEAYEGNLGVTLNSISEYIHQRRAYGFAESSLVVGELTEGIHVSSAIYYSLPMQRLVQATNDIVNWHNDIQSFQKELLAGEVNLVHLISKREGVRTTELQRL